MSDVDKGCKDYHRRTFPEIGLCECQKNRINRIEAVWQKYQRYDEVLCDNDWLPGSEINYLRLIYDLWQAIRREGDNGRHISHGP